MKGGGRVLGEGRSVGSEEGALPCACSTEWMAPSADGARCQDLQLLNVKCKVNQENPSTRLPRSAGGQEDVGNLL